MKSIDWTTFTRRIEVKAPINIIYKTWTSQEGLESFFLSKAEFRDSNGTIRARDVIVDAGNEYTWMWHGSDYIGNGSVISCNGNNEFTFTFEESSVEVTILDEGGKHIVNLRQYNIATDDQSKLDYFVGCSGGWTFYLANLKSILEGGIDLRNKDDSIKRVVNT